MYTARTRYTNLNPSPEKTSLHVLGSCARPVDDFNSIQASLDKVDVRAATCLSPEVTKAVLDEVELGMGVLACNTLIVGLLRKALVDQARVALAGLSVAERRTSHSVLVPRLAMLLQSMGKLEEARPLLEEELRAKINTLGDFHEDTLLSMVSTGMLLESMGKLEEAKPLFEKVLRARRNTLSDRHEDTLHSIINTGLLLMDMGKLEEAKPLLEEALQASKEVLGEREPPTDLQVPRGSGDDGAKGASI